MKTIILGTFFLSFALLQAEETCHKCEVIREENKTKDFNQGCYYYEDYLKLQEAVKSIQEEEKAPEEPQSAKVK